MSIDEDEIIELWEWDTDLHRFSQISMGSI